MPIYDRVSGRDYVKYVRILENDYIELFKAGDSTGLKVWTYARDLVYAGKLTWDDVAKFANDVKNADILAHEFNNCLLYTSPSPRDTR